MALDFLNQLFGTGTGAPTVLPGATPAPSKGRDIAMMLAKLAAGAGNGMMAAQGYPQPAPQLNHDGNVVGASILKPRQKSPYSDNIGALLGRIFGTTNDTSALPDTDPTMSAPASTIKPMTIGTGTGGLY